MLKRHIFIANAMELRLFRIKPFMSNLVVNTEPV